MLSHADVIEHYGMQPVQRLSLGQTEISVELLHTFLHSLGSKFSAVSYDLFENNCNHFSNEVAQFLVGTTIPQHIMDLPQQVLASPMGPMLRPMFENMQATMSSKGSAASFLPPMTHENAVLPFELPTTTTMPPPVPSGYDFQTSGLLLKLRTPRFCPMDHNLATTLVSDWSTRTKESSSLFDTLVSCMSSPPSLVPSPEAPSLDSTSTLEFDLLKKLITSSNSDADQTLGLVLLQAAVCQIAGRNYVLHSGLDTWLLDTFETSSDAEIVALVVPTLAHLLAMDVLYPTPVLPAFRLRFNRTDTKSRVSALWHSLSRKDTTGELMEDSVTVAAAMAVHNFTLGATEAPTTPHLLMAHNLRECLTDLESDTRLESVGKTRLLCLGWMIGSDADLRQLAIELKSREVLTRLLTTRSCAAASEMDHGTPSQSTVIGDSPLLIKEVLALL